VNIDFDTLFPDVRESGETQLNQCPLVMLRLLKIFQNAIQIFVKKGSLNPSSTRYLQLLQHISI
jgi:hypothetical protein